MVTEARSPIGHVHRVIAGSCHCGAVRVALPARPRTLTACNCSICRRYGALWAYFTASRVRIEYEPGAMAGYLWGTRRLRFVRCARCGCVTHWERARPGPASRIGVNARMFDPDALGPVPIRRLDGARTWRYLD
jgi:hypothetical protein